MGIEMFSCEIDGKYYVIPTYDILLLRFAKIDRLNVAYEPILKNSKVCIDPKCITDSLTLESITQHYLHEFETDKSLVKSLASFK